MNELVELNQERENTRRELGDKWSELANSRVRVLFNDKKELLLARIEYLLKKNKSHANDVTYTVVAATLSDAGRHSEALRKYKLAFDVAPVGFSKTLTKRQYGRGLILTGKVDEGRALMKAAADELDSLRKTSGFDNDVLQQDRAEVYKRMIAAQLQNNSKEHLAEDFSVFKAIISELKDPGRRNDLLHSAIEIENSIRDALSPR